MSKSITLSELVHQVSQLPPLPQAVRAVSLALQRDELSADRCIALIESDLALAARTLRLANSAFYGAPGRVGSIGDAVRMLGLRTVSGVLTAASMHGLLPAAPCPGFDFTRYWRHAVTTALAARALAGAAVQDPDQAFLAGLMHDIGQLVLVALQPGSAAAALALARESACTVAEAEQLVFGYTHAHVGALVAEHWRFPANIVRAIADHHETEPALDANSSQFRELIQLADAVALALEQGQHAPDAVAMIGRPWLSLKLGPEDALRIFAMVAEGSREMDEALSQA